MKKKIQIPENRLLNPKGDIPIQCAADTCNYLVSSGTHAYILLDAEGKIMLVWHSQCYSRENIKDYIATSPNAKRIHTAFLRQITGAPRRANAITRT